MKLMDGSTLANMDHVQNRIHTDVLLRLVRRVTENRQNKKYMEVLMVDISAAFANTS
jgi:hypothetical protein